MRWLLACSWPAVRADALRSYALALHRAVAATALAIARRAAVAAAVAAAVTAALAVEREAVDAVDVAVAA